MSASAAQPMVPPVVRCAWCDEPAERCPPAAAVSHGICPDCLRRATARALRLAAPPRQHPGDDPTPR